MPRDVKKLTALGLLLLIAVPLFFSVGILVKQRIIQLHREERFEKEVLQTISIPIEKLFWVKPGKEILVDGELFDVKSFRSDNKKVLLTGFFDDKEDKLVKDINDLIHEKKESNSPFSQLAIKFLLLPLYNAPTCFSFQSSWQIISGLFSTYTEVILKGSYPLVTPPPKYC